MKAKFYVKRVIRTSQHDQLSLEAVTMGNTGPDGLNENNSFSKWTPSGSLEMTVTNPALLGTFEPGREYYLDFTLVPLPEPPPA